MPPTEQRTLHLSPTGPKRILSLDGGGVRGIISLAFLERIESLLQIRTNRPNLRLCDYFSLIGGTSTGAIIAAGLALGHSVSELIDLYLEISHQSFVASGWRPLRWLLNGSFLPKFDERALRNEIIRHFGHEQLGSDRLRCGLGIVAKRLDTSSVWLFHNHPEGRFFGSNNATEEYTPNRNIEIANLLRASTAAPAFFRPQDLEVAPGINGLFVDGGVSPHNNPALLMLMLASLKGYGFRWPMGEDRLMMVSVGTGSPKPRPWGGSYRNQPALWFAGESLLSMMYDANWLTQTMLQWMSESPTAWPIDSEVEDLKDDFLGGAKLLHYVRYEAPLEEDWLTKTTPFRFTPTELSQLQRIDVPKLAPKLLEIGRAAAKAQIQPQHFPARFDLL